MTISEVQGRPWNHMKMPQPSGSTQSKEESPSERKKAPVKRESAQVIE